MPWTAAAALSCGERTYRTVSPFNASFVYAVEYDGPVLGALLPVPVAGAPSGCVSLAVAARRQELLRDVRVGCVFQVEGGPSASRVQFDAVLSPAHGPCNGTAATVRSRVSRMLASVRDDRATQGAPPHRDAKPAPEGDATSQLPMHQLFSALGDDFAAGGTGAHDASSDNDAVRKCIRHGHGGPIVGHTRVTPDQAAAMSLLQVAHHLSAVARGTAGAHDRVGTGAGTIFEVIIHAATNAFAYLTPRVVYMVAREAVTDLLTNVRADTADARMVAPSPP